MNYNRNNSPYFPYVELKNNDVPEMQNLQIQAYGKRIIKDQTVPEYLLEFLLVFIGEYNGKSGFDKVEETYDTEVKYKVDTNIGLKRFIFFENSKLENRFSIDSEAYERLNEKLSKNIKGGNYNSEDILNIIQELFYGFSSVTKNRGWFAQSLMPVCEDVIFPEAMGKKSMRKDLVFDKEGKAIDKEFEFKAHNFMARGGEVYYLHVLQGLEKEPQLKNSIGSNIRNLINSYPQLSTLSRWITDNWNEFMKEKCKNENIVEELKEELKCQWITQRYSRRSSYTVKELNSLLMCETSEFEKIDLLNTGIVIQILRMMVESSVCITQDKLESNPMWLIHVPSTSEVDKKIKKLAVEEYKNIEEHMEVSIAKMLENKKHYTDKNNIEDKKTESTILTTLKEANDDSFKLMRKLGKDIGLITPIRGDNMRFSINDSIIRYFVLSLVEPGTKITLNSFLTKLYNHYGIVIGQNEYTKYVIENNINQEKDTSFLNYNLIEFQSLLRKNGFLRELSDATSIVENPYRKTGEFVDEVVYSSC